MRSGRRPKVAERPLSLLLPVRHRLLPWVVVAAAIGVALPTSSAALSALVPVFLGGQVLGVALTLAPADLRSAARHTHLVAIALVVQWTTLPALGLLLHLLAPSPSLAIGILVCAVAPAEITSGLMAAIAGGDVAIATVCMAASLALSTVLTPLWLSVGLGSEVRVDSLSLAGELALSVLLPLVVGLILRARFPQLARWRHLWLDFSAVCLLLVVLAGTASARMVLLSGAVLTILPLVVALLVGGAAAGWGLGRVLRLRHRQATAVAFPIGIREFGVAIAVAVAIAPKASAVGGVYGIVMVAGAGTFATWMGGRTRATASRP